MPLHHSVQLNCYQGAREARIVAMFVFIARSLPCYLLVRAGPPPQIRSLPSFPFLFLDAALQCIATCMIASPIANVSFFRISRLGRVSLSSLMVSTCCICARITRADNGNSRKEELFTPAASYKGTHAPGRV